MTICRGLLGECEDCIWPKCEGKLTEKFSVCQFFSDTQYEYVRRNVTAEEAVMAFQNYTQNPAANIGITKRVIITDSGDCICLEWEHGKGITFGEPQ